MHPPLSPQQLAFRKAFFNAILDTPLDPTDPRYVPIYENSQHSVKDPVEILATTIEMLPGQSVQLLSGFRGTGKSTELRRLRRRLAHAGYQVFLVDMEDYLDVHSPVDVSHFLMAVAGAFGDALVSDLFPDPQRVSYWERLHAFFTQTQIKIDGFGAAGINIKAGLKSDPVFRERLQTQLAGRLGALVSDVRAYIQGCVQLVKGRFGPDTEVVLIADSIEHVRGGSRTEEAVLDSMQTLFVNYAEKLHLPYLHVIYTVPPYLKVLFANVSGLYDPGGMRVLPSIKLREQAGALHQGGLDVLERIVAARGDWRVLLGERAVLDRLSLLSGGQLRDLMRLLGEVLRCARTFPASPQAVDEAIDQIRSESFPIPDDDSIRLAGIAETHGPALKTKADVLNMARYLDSHLVLCYRNGQEWYNVHPLIEEAVLKKAQALRRRQAAAEAQHGE